MRRSSASPRVWAGLIAVILIAFGFGTGKSAVGAWLIILGVLIVLCLVAFSAFSSVRRRRST